MDLKKNYKKATQPEEVDNAVRFDLPITVDDSFFTEFSDVRGDFEDRTLYKALNVRPGTFVYNEKLNKDNRTLLFLSGMRGSGKTSELTRITKNLHHKDAFFCVTCNLDEGVDTNDMEYMDILIFQLECLFKELNKQNIYLGEDIIKSLQSWFSERIQEVNKVIKKKGEIGIEVKAETSSLLSFIGLAAKVKANIQGSKENADTIRTALRTNFTDFALKINEFISEVTIILRSNNIARALLFVIDGLEKAATAEIRRRIVIDEANRIKRIEANTIFTLPIELRSEGQRLIAFSTVISFPFIKIKERGGKVVEKAVDRFLKFTYKRIDKSLFDSEETVRHAILMGGGSPREYLRILEYANMFADDEKGKIDREAVDKGIKKLAAQTAQFLTKKELETLKELEENNRKGIPTLYSEEWQDLLEKLIVMEYNDGSFKRVNPLAEVSEMYQHYVARQLQGGDKASV